MQRSPEVYRNIFTCKHIDLKDNAKLEINYKGNNDLRIIITQKSCYGPSMHIKR